MPSRFGKDRLDQQNQGPLQEPCLVLCEGKRDASFVLHLLKQRGLAGFQVGFPDPETSGGFGKSAFGPYLTFLKARRGYQQLRHLVLVADNDADPPAALRAIKEQLESAGYPIPSEVGVTSADSAPTVTVWMLPGREEPGNLDTFLLRAALAGQHPLHQCFDDFWRCCHIDELPIGKASRVKLTTVVAASCLENPSTSLVWVWSQPGNPIDLSHRCFDNLEAFFTRLLHEAD